MNYVEKLHHELIPNLSSTKSPHMIVGKLVKTYFISGGVVKGSIRYKIMINSIQD